MSDHLFMLTGLIAPFRELIWHQRLMLPVIALFHLLHEFGLDHFRAARDGPPASVRTWSPSIRWSVLPVTGLSNACRRRTGR